MIRFEFRPNVRHVTPVEWSIDGGFAGAADRALVEQLWCEVWRVAVTGDEVDWVEHVTSGLRGLTRRSLRVVYVGDDARFLAANVAAIVLDWRGRDAVRV